MKIEKINENKIKIILNHQDLASKNIDFHTFMANTIDSQDLFFDVLNTAEKEFGFDTKNYQVRIDAFAISSGDFILTITRSLPSEVKDLNILTPSKKKVTAKRKKTSYDFTNIIYSFNSFDDFCNFISFFYFENLPYSNIAKNIVLYEYKDNYYLLFKQINLNYTYLKKLFSFITEFATYKTNPDLFITILSENGKIIMKNNAIKTAMEYFINNR